MNRFLQCECGKLRGQLSDTQACTRIACYCTDCQAFARFLGDPNRVLDDLGGSAVVLSHPQQVAFTQGVEHLACMSLSEKGLYRWYASCCNTAIGNTARNRKLAFAGISETCLKDPVTSLESAFGPVRMRSMVKGATGKVASSGWRAIPVMLHVVSMVIGARLGGSYRRTPFFNADGAPIVPPRVLSSEERRRLDQPSPA